MEKKLILLVSDEQTAISSLENILGADFALETAKDRLAAINILQNRRPDLVFLDHDLRSWNGMQFFYDLHAIQPDINVIMFSAQNNIPQAVAAAKAGAADYLQKPFQADQVREAVGRNLSRKEIRLSIPENVAWLRGGSTALKTLLDTLRQSLYQNADMILLAEKGIDKKALAEIIHNSGARRKRKFVALDLSTFKKEMQEANFWTLVQEIMALPDGESMVEEKDRCGTIYFDSIEQTEEHFRQGLIGFLQERRRKIDKSIRVILGASLVKLENIEAIKKLEGFVKMTIPPLRTRKEDLSLILEGYFNEYSEKYNKGIRYIEIELLSLLASYDFPGNYRELEKITEEAMLLATSETLKIKDLPLDFIALLQIELKSLVGKELPLTKAKREFEKRLYKVILDKLHGDDSAAARFLDIPRNILNQRMEDLLA
jgi:two-component system response regulator HydG